MQTACRIVRKIFNALTDAVWPRCCAVCGNTLVEGEEGLCISCMTRLPRTCLHRNDFNIIHQRLGSHVPLHKAMAWFWYYRGSAETAVIIDAKYHDRPTLIRSAAAFYTTELQADGCDPSSFADVVVPTPMHWRKRAVRGYNQTEWLAEGISRACGLPVANCLRATRTHRSQTRLNATERMQNLQDSIELTRPQAIEGRRVLLVDDIITTGATMRAALKALATGCPASVSILALGAAKMQ